MGSSELVSGQKQLRLFARPPTHSIDGVTPGANATRLAAFTYSPLCRALNYARPISIDTGNRAPDSELHSLGGLSLGGGGGRGDSAGDLPAMDAPRRAVPR